MTAPVPDSPLFPAVYIPGWSDRGTGWQPLADVLGPMGDLPMPMAGFSAVSDPVAFPDRAALAVRCPRTILVGWSLGAMAALQTAVLRPQAVAGVVLLAGSLRFCDRDRSLGHPPRLLASMRKAAESDPDATVERFLRGLFTQDEWQRGDLDAYLAAHHAAGTNAWTLPALVAGLEYLEATDLRAVAQDLDLPVLWLHGSDDTVCPIGGMRAARDQFGDRPNWDFVEIPDAGHALAWSAPDAVIRHIREWQPWQHSCADWI